MIHRQSVLRYRIGPGRVPLQQVDLRYGIDPEIILQALAIEA